MKKWIKSNIKSICLYGAIFLILIPIFAYILFYRGIYRNELDKKIIVGMENRDLPIRQGEVTKIVKLLVCYVKVKYQDENGATKEEWARSWFTHKEAKFLQQKKIITIVPYKNTYGILEEMSATR